jgi:hypothetical protein
METLAAIILLSGAIYLIVAGCLETAREAKQDTMKEID